MYNIETLYKAGNSVINFFDNYSLIASKNKYETIHWEKMVILTPKQKFK